jgi:hypothetical protein
MAAACLLLGMTRGQLCWAEDGFVLVLVKDVHDHPVRGVETGFGNNGTSMMTGSDGKVQIPHVASVKQGDWFPIVIVHSPPGEDLAMISPWDRALVYPEIEGSLRKGHN